jgi:hypothetical protein
MIQPTLTSFHELMKRKIRGIRKVLMRKDRGTRKTPTKQTKGKAKRFEGKEPNEL